MTKPERFLNEAKSLACIHCGLCLTSCPTYLETGNENNSPRGRIYLMRAVQEGRLALSQTPVSHIDSCLGCRACEAVCPSGVQYGDLLEHMRDHIEKNYRRSAFQTFLRRVVIEKVFPFPARLRLALMSAKAFRATRLEKLLPGFARDAMALAPENVARVTLPEVSPAIGKTRARAGFFTGCVMSVMFGETNAASVRLLNRAGCDVVIPRGQVCCGALYAHNGRLGLARDSARRNIEAFEREPVDAIYVNAAGCGSAMKEYGELLGDDPDWAERAKKFSARVKDLTEFPAAMEFELPVSKLKIQEKVTYHDACHLAHAQRITKPPRELVQAVAGNNFVELPEADVCCGSAGTYNLTEPEMAARLQTRKIENILRSGAQIVVTSNPGCLLQIQAGLRKAKSPIQVLHIADFLDRAISGPEKHYKPSEL